MEQLREHGEVRRGWIGITMNTQGVDDAAREYYGLNDAFGVLIERVTEGGPADEAGLRRFDIVRSVNGTVVRDNLDLISKIASQQPGDTVSLEVLRDGKTKTIDVVLGDRDQGLRADATRRSRDPETPEQHESKGMGFTVEDLNPMLRERMGLESGQRGVLITAVEFDTEAADKGLTPMTLVTSINDRTVEDLGDFDDALKRVDPGDVVKVAGVDLRGNPFSVYLRMPR
jgi:serine protease Do